MRFKISHDGYLPRFGVTHERRITLAPEGDVLEGEDRLEGHYTGPADAQVAIRFPPASIHPRQRDPGRADRDAGPARRRDLAGRGGPGFLFELEESIFLAATDGAKRTQQLVLSCPAQMKKAAQWRFERLTGAR